MAPLIHEAAFSCKKVACLPSRPETSRKRAHIIPCLSWTNKFESIVRRCPSPAFLPDSAPLRNFCLLSGCMQSSGWITARKCAYFSIFPFESLCELHSTLVNTRRWARIYVSSLYRYLHFVIVLRSQRPVPCSVPFPSPPSAPRLPVDHRPATHFAAQTSILQL